MKQEEDTRRELKLLFSLGGRGKSTENLAGWKRGLDKAKPQMHRASICSS